jgi:hypothetical protein
MAPQRNPESFPRMIRSSAGSLCLLALLAGCSTDVDLPIDPVGNVENCDQLPAPSPGGLGCITDRYTAEVAVHGDYAYTSTWGRRGSNNGNLIYVWDVRAAVPVLVDSVTVSNASTTGDLQVSDDGRLLVVATEYSPGSIVVYDLTDPRRPQQLSRFTSTNTGPGVHTAEIARVGGRLHGFLSIDPGGGSPARLVIVDLNNPANPVELTALTIGQPFVHDVFVRDGILFAAVWNQGVRIYDIGGGGRGGTPSAPVQISQFATQGGAAHNLWWFHDPSDGSKRYLLVGEEQAGSIGSSSAGDIHVLDVSDLAAPREVAFYTVPGAGTHNFSMDEPGGILYAAYYNGGVRAINVRGDLASCTPAQKDALGRCDLGAMGRQVGRVLHSPIGSRSFFIWGVQYTGGKVYASDMLNGLWKLNTPLAN